MYKNIKELLRKLSYILTYQQKVYGIIVVVMSFITAGFELLGVSVIVPLVNAMLNPQELKSNSFFSAVFSYLKLYSDSQIIITVVLGVIIVYIAKNAFFCFNAWVRLKYSCKIQRECSIKMFSSYLKRGYPFFLNHNINEMLQGAVGDISGLYAMISSILQMITQSTMIILIVIYMICSDWQMALGIIAAAALCLTVITIILKRKLKEAGIGIRKYAILVNKILLEAFNGIREVIVMRRQGFYIDKYEKGINRKQRYQIVQGLGAEIPAYLIEAICILGIMGMLCVRILSINDKERFVATLAAFAVGAFRILPGLGKISTAVNSIVSYTPNLNAIYENIRTTAELQNIKYLESDKQYNDNNDKEKVDDFIKLSIKDLCFGYDVEHIGMVLNGISLDINRGESVAFIGETGAGKSTLADIILGLLNPTKGTVEVNGKDISLIPEEWSKMMAFVPQSIYLTDDSIRANVAFCEDDKDIDDNRVRTALEDANILEFIDSLPDGLNTEIGDRGMRISGGQCQRIGIARALYRRPQILVLDEATSALDNDTERVVMEAIERLQGKMTMIIIAHRLTTIKNCDRIYEIKNGKVNEKRYDEL